MRFPRGIETAIARLPLLSSCIRTVDAVKDCASANRSKPGRGNMQYENVILHNTEEANEVEGRDGLRLQRVPESVRVELNPSAQEKMLNPDNAEIRFRLRSGPVKLTLSSEGHTDAVVLFGQFQANGEFVRLTDQKQTIEITLPERLAQLDPQHCEGMTFNPRVCRIVFGRLANSPVYIHSVQGDVEPPSPDDVPKTRYLAYGTSITHGASASRPYLSYAAQTAWRLGADLINLGSGGSALCEHAIADHIAGRQDWNIASLALSVNMIGGFSREEFRERCAYMVNAVAGSDTGRSVFCITLYPHWRDFGGALAGEEDTKKAADFRDILRAIVRDCPHPNVHLVEGPDILDNISGLGSDLLHPTDLGMIRMGENLAAAIKRRLR